MRTVDRPERPYLGQKELDDVMRMNTELLAELWILRDRVTALQPAQRRLATAGGRELQFDACIVAVGALWNTHHIPGVTRHAMPFRSVSDAVAI